MGDNRGVGDSPLFGNMRGDAGRPPGDSRPDCGMPGDSRPEGGMPGDNSPEAAIPGDRRLGADTAEGDRRVWGTMSLSFGSSDGKA